MSESKIHGPMEGSRPACGRRDSAIDHSWASVTCEDCNAARRSDEAQLTLGPASTKTFPAPTEQGATHERPYSGSVVS